MDRRQWPMPFNTRLHINFAAMKVKGKLSLCQQENHPGTSSWYSWLIRALTAVARQMEHGSCRAQRKFWHFSVACLELCARRFTVFSAFISCWRGLHSFKLRPAIIPWYFTNVSCSFLSPMSYATHALIVKVDDFDGTHDAFPDAMIIWNGRWLIRASDRHSNKSQCSVRRKCAHRQIAQIKRHSRNPHRPLESTFLLRFVIKPIPCNN